MSATSELTDDQWQSHLQLLGAIAICNGSGSYALMLGGQSAAWWNHEDGTLGLSSPISQEVIEFHWRGYEAPWGDVPPATMAALLGYTRRTWRVL